MIHYPYPFQKPIRSGQIRQGLPRVVQFWPTCLWPGSDAVRLGVWVSPPSDSCLRVTFQQLQQNTLPILKTSSRWLWLDELNEQHLPTLSMLLENSKHDRLLLDADLAQEASRVLPEKTLKRMAFVLRMNGNSDQIPSPWAIHAHLSMKGVVYAGFHLLDEAGEHGSIPLDIVALKRFLTTLQADIFLPLSIGGGVQRLSDAENITRVTVPDLAVALCDPMSEPQWKDRAIQGRIVASRAKLRLRHSP